MTPARIRLRNWLGSTLLAFTALSAPLASAQEAAQAPAVRPALWKVADEDTTIWLFGTIHVLPEQVDWYAGPVAKALDSAQELVTEIPIDDTGQAQQTILQMAARKDGKSLRDTLSAKERTAYEGALTSIGIPAQAFDANDAWFAALMLTLIPLKTAGYNTETGIDQQVAARARARHLANHAFETVDYQISLFDNLSEPTQRAYLDEVVEALPDVKTDVDRMVAAWKAGDADHLAELMNEDESDPEIRKVLITDRNANWAKWLKARLDKPGTVFVAVGAGHLAGPGSVQDQLAAAGVSSTRVQ
ncbi:TraB/GumN family protein [Novosphingobium resinovorum]|uniref:TraB/GumN family protein n=1 Tax=Novosphingobium resinovorum TaxID=158500 RepID=UPI002ED572AD|nr:TraB/GumN family protein [Novosphingobium resinovorum]